MQDKNRMDVKELKKFMDSEEFKRLKINFINDISDSIFIPDVNFEWRKEKSFLPHPPFCFFIDARTNEMFHAYIAGYQNAKNLLQDLYKNQKSIEPEFQKVIEENFLELFE